MQLHVGLRAVSLAEFLVNITSSYSSGRREASFELINTKHHNLSHMPPVSVVFIYATADEADAYMFYICFFCFLFVFCLFFSCFFFVRQKI